MMAASYLFRPAKLSDMDMLTELCLLSKASLGYEADFIEACRPVLHVRESWVLEDVFQVAETVQGEAAGCIRLQRSGEQAETGELATFFIHPDHQRQGLGKRLFDLILAEAAELGLRRLKLESEPLSEAFYERLGFRRIGMVPSEAIEGRHLPLMELVLKRAQAVPD